jgi:hypothetical protein
MKDENTSETGLDYASMGIDIDAITEEERKHSEAIQAAVSLVEVKTRKDGKPIGHKPLDDEELQGKRTTPRMEAFASFIVGGDSAPEAYRKAYDCSRSTNATVVANANKLLNDARITLLLEPLYKARKEMVINDELAIRRFVMSELFTHAREADGVGHKLKALELMGKSIGLFAERADGERDDLDVEKLKDELKKKMASLLSTDAKTIQ